MVNIPESKEGVAYCLYQDLRRIEVDRINKSGETLTAASLLSLYTKCLKATYTRTDYRD